MTQNYPRMGLCDATRRLLVSFVLEDGKLTFKQLWGRGRCIGGERGNAPAGLDGVWAAGLQYIGFRMVSRSRRVWVPWLSKGKLVLPFQGVSPGQQALLNKRIFPLLR